jgi:hypothetical protein
LTTVPLGWRSMKRRTPPVFIAQRIRDLEAPLHGDGVDSIDIRNRCRDAGRCHVVVADDGPCAEELLGDARVMIQPTSITTSKPRSTKKSRVTAGRSDLMFGTVLLIAMAQFYRRQ